MSLAKGPCLDSQKCRVSMLFFPAMLLEAGRVFCDGPGPKIAKAIIAERRSYPFHMRGHTCQKPIVGHDGLSL